MRLGRVHGYRHRQDSRGGLAGCTASLFRLHGSAGSGAQLHDLRLSRQHHHHGHRHSRQRHDRRLYHPQQQQHRQRALHPAVADPGALSQRLVAARQLHRRHHRHALRAELRLGHRHPARRRQLQDGGQRQRRPRLSLSTAPTRPASSSRRCAAPGSPTPSTPSATRPSATSSSATSTPARRRQRLPLRHPASTFTTINRPGPFTARPPTASTATASPAARAAGPGLSRAYILNQDTGVYTTYDAPGTGTVVTHFEGITSGGRANTFNLVADSVDANGRPMPGRSMSTRRASRPGSQLAVPLCGSTGTSACVTSGNSIYGNTAIGVYVKDGVTSSYIINVPGLYNPITNSGTLHLRDGRHRRHRLQRRRHRQQRHRSWRPAQAASASAAGPTASSPTTARSPPAAAGGVGVQLTGNFGTLLNYGTINAPTNGLAIQTGSGAAGTPGVQCRRDQRRGLGQRRIVRPLREQWLDGRHGGRRRRHPRHQRHLRPDLDGHAVAARRAGRRRRPARGQRRGAACRHHADGVPAGHRLQQELQPGHRDGRPHRHVQHAVDREPAGLPERQPGLRQHQRDAQPAIVAGHLAGAGHQSDRRRPGARRRLQQRLRPQCDAGPVQPDGEQHRLCADGAVGQQCQRRPVQRRDRRRPVRDPAGQSRGHAAGAAAAGDGGACRMHRSRRLPGWRRGRQLERKLECLGQRLRRRAVAQYRPRHGRAGGAAVDRRRRLRRRLQGRAADGAGRGPGA